MIQNDGHKNKTENISNEMLWIFRCEISIFWVKNSNYLLVQPNRQHLTNNETPDFQHKTIRLYRSAQPALRLTNERATVFCNVLIISKSLGPNNLHKISYRLWTHRLEHQTKGNKFMTSYSDRALIRTCEANNETNTNNAIRRAIRNKTNDFTMWRSLFYQKKRDTWAQFESRRFFEHYYAY